MSDAADGTSKENNTWSTLRVKRVLIYSFLIIFFAVSSILGTPFRYDEGKSGRYLLSVLKNADLELFPNDPVVESLSRFRSLFYDTLGIAFKITGSPPQLLEPTLRVLYAISKVLLFLSLFGLTRVISNDLWFFFLFAGWATFSKSSRVGGEALFSPDLTHDEIAFLLGFIGIAALFRRREIVFWLLLSISIFVHSLVALHLFLCLIPAWFIMQKKVNRQDFFGLAFFIVCALGYYFFYAPPGMTAEEGRIFWSIKGNINHISPFNQGLIQWATVAGLIMLSLLAYHSLAKDDWKAKVLAGCVVFGTVIGLSLGILAWFTEIPRLGQLQPMRIFVWVFFFSNLLICLTTIQALRRSLLVGPILLTELVLHIIDSPWALLFIYMSVGYFILNQLSAINRWINTKRVEWLTRLGTGAVLIGMFAVWAISYRLPYLSARQPAPYLLALVTLTMVFSPTIFQKWRLLLSIVMVLAMVISAFNRHDYYSVHTDRDWDTLRRWVEQNTEKSDSFVTAVEGAGNFRTLSMRTSVNESQSALAWVDPILSVKNGEMSVRVNQGYDGSTWDLTYLFSLCQEWQAKYVIVKGPYQPGDVLPVYQVGLYSIFLAQHARPLY